MVDAASPGAMNARQTDRNIHFGIKDKAVLPPWIQKLAANLEPRANAQLGDFDSLKAVHGPGSF
jgi:hypothetical protein